MTPEQQKFYDIKHTSDYKTVGEDIDYKVFVDHDKKEVVLQFEESDSREDWIHNFQFLPWPLRLDDKIIWTSRGYACAYKSASDTPLFDWFAQYLRIKEPDYKLCIRGWSFGSAMAKIAARHFTIMSGYKDWKVLDELTTYGDVKCWVNPFYSLKKHVRVLHEYACINDGVTWCLPLYWRDKTSRVGPKFSIRDLFKSEYYHTHYEEYDYSKYEK
jgi:hypothetical protein